MNDLNCAICSLDYTTLDCCTFLRFHGSINLKAKGCEESLGDYMQQRCSSSWKHCFFVIQLITTLGAFYFNSALDFLCAKLQRLGLTIENL